MQTSVVSLASDSHPYMETLPCLESVNHRIVRLQTNELFKGLFQWKKKLFLYSILKYYEGKGRASPGKKSRANGPRYKIDT